MVFQLRQSAEAALALEPESRKLAAGALGLVETRLNDSGITPDVFLEFADKEYTSQTIRLIAENKRRLMAQLTAAEIDEIGRVTNAVDRLPDYHYYLSSYQDAKRLETVAPIVAQYGARNSIIVKLGSLIVPLFLASVAFFALILGSEMTALVCVLLAIAGRLLYQRWQHAKEYNEAKRVADDANAKVDMPRFAALDREFGSVARAEELQREGQRAIAEFFGENQLLPA